MAESPMADLRRRCDEITKEFNEKHPAKAAAGRFVNMLFQDAPGVGEAATQQERQHQRAADELCAYHGMVCDMFESAPIEIEEVIFKRELRLMMACFACGMHSAPDGRKGREAWSDQAGTQFIMLVQTVMIYLREHPSLEAKASINFANSIRADILDALG